MVLHCTYCSSKKNTDSSLLPAIDRYVSKRIQKIFETAKCAKINFAILSGKFGLLRPTNKIPYYDHLLKSEDVKEHAELISEQLQVMGITDLYYFTESAKSDPNIKPYLECIRFACDKNGITLKIIEEKYSD